MPLIELSVGADNDPRRVEWLAVTTITQHFNDLLMRLRAFGLPLVGTIAGAGFTLGLNSEFARLSDWTAAVFVTANAALLVAIVPFLLWVRGWGSKGAEPLNGTERLMWWIPVAVAVAMAVAFWTLVCADRIDLTAKHTYKAGPLILFFALAVLVVFYALDRFYYFKLLLGAIARATELEKQLGFRTTATVSQYVLPQHAASIVTLLYFLPGIAGYVALLILVGLNPVIGSG